jgi:hypothetical protein
MFLRNTHRFTHRPLSLSFNDRTIDYQPWRIDDQLVGSWLRRTNGEMRLSAANDVLHSELTHINAVERIAELIAGQREREHNLFTVL